MAQFNAKNFDTYRQYLAKLRQKSEDPQYQAYQKIVFSFLAVALFAWFAIRPTIQTIIQLRREIKDKEEVNGKMSEKIGALIDAQGQYQQVSAQLPLLTQALPMNPDVVNLVDQLSKLITSSNASIANMAVSKVDLGTTKIDNTNQKAKLEKAQQLANTDTSSEKSPTVPVVRGPAIQKILVSFSISGAYADLESVIERLQNLRRIITVNSVAFSNPMTSGDTSGKYKPGDLVLDVKLESYYLEK